MAATAEPSDDLDLARRALDELGDEVITRGPWRASPTPNLGGYYLELELRPDGLTAGGPIPEATVWIALVSDSYPLGQINLMPATKGGIEATFPHQESNDASDPVRPWRMGKVCLVDTIHGHELAAKRDDPTDPYQRLAWHVGRLLGWLRLASAGKLLTAGQPFELPIFGQFLVTGPRVGFFENDQTFAFWSSSDVRSGRAEVVEVANPPTGPILAVRAWHDPHGRTVLAPPWGHQIESLKRVEDAVWFRVDKPFIRPPWRSPQTIEELSAYGTDQGVDILATITRERKLLSEHGEHQILIGFPIPAVVGEGDSRMQWVSFRLGRLTSANRKGKKGPIIAGFRDTRSIGFVDQRPGGPLEGKRRIVWSKTQNWAPEELAARGRFEGNLRARKIALIGAGTLGAAIGNLLVRGGAGELIVVDGDQLEAPNLSRHELSLGDVGRPKAVALATRLNQVSPSARVTGIVSDFPVSGDDRKRLEDVELVIDATASESAIRALGDHAWAGETRFASASFSFAARRLYLYTAIGQSFPAADFMTQIDPWLTADARPPEDFPHEGTGCWSSVFPARADDVALLAAIAVRRIDAAAYAADGAETLTVFERQDDGTVTVASTP